MELNSNNADDKAFQKYLEDNPGAKKCQYHFHWESLKPYYVQCPHCKHKNSFNLHVQLDAQNEVGYYSSNTVDLVQCENKECKKEFKWE